MSEQTSQAHNCPPLSFPSQPDALKICGILFAHAWNIIQRWHLPQSAATTAHLSKGERNWFSLLSHHFRWKQKEPTPFSKGERTGCLLPHHFGWKKAATYAVSCHITSDERKLQPMRRNFHTHLSKGEREKAEPMVRITSDERKPQPSWRNPNALPLPPMVWVGGPPRFLRVNIMGISWNVWTNIASSQYIYIYKAENMYHIIYIYVYIFI